MRPPLAYSKRELEFLRRHNHLPRIELFVKFQARFSREDVTKSNLRDQMRRMDLHYPYRGPRRPAIIYSKEELSFLKRRKKMARRQLHAIFVATFDRQDVPLDRLKNLLTRNRWVRPAAPIKHYSRAEIAFVRKNFSMTHRSLHERFVEKFDRHDVTAQNLKDLCCRNGWHNGLKSAEKPPGWERVNGNGFVEVRTEQSHPAKYNRLNYTLKHRLLWEREHGPIPKGHVLKCVDGNRLNTEPSNWLCIPNGMISRLNKRGFAAAPTTLKPTILAVARLDHEVHQATATE